MGSVVPVYNLVDEIDHPLMLSLEDIALIFQRNITSWNDPRLRGRVLLPTLNGTRDIVVVRRNDSSGTTFAFADPVNRVAKAIWKLGASGMPRWPAGTLAGDGYVYMCV